MTGDNGITVCGTDDQGMDVVYSDASSPAKDQKDKTDAWIA